MPQPDTPKKRSISPKKSQSSGTAKKPIKKEVAPGGPDIRNFFGQGSSGGPSKPALNGNTLGTGTKPITIDDSDDEEEKKPAVPAKATTSKHFQSQSSKSASSSSKQPIPLHDSPGPSPRPTSKASETPKAKMPAIKRKSVKDQSESEEDVKPASKRQSLAGGRAKPTKTNYLESSGEEEEEVEDVKPAKKAVVKVKEETGSQSGTPVKAKGKAARKAPSPMSIDDDDEDDFIDDDDEAPNKSKAKPKAAAKKAPPAKKAPADKPPAKKSAPKKAVKEENNDDDEGKPAKPKHDWRAAAAARSAGPRNPGGKEIPEGAPGCLEGLTFVFTGELESLGRDEAQELVKRYSGRVTGAPSSRTSYVVVGDNAGESKMTKIKELKVATINEDEFLELIRSRSGGELDDKQVKAKEKEEQKIAQAAKDMEAREREEEKARKRKEAALKDTGIAAKKAAPLSAQLWTTKYAPQNLKEICGNKAPVERLGQWLQDWDKCYKSGFKKPGKDGMGMYRAVLISGPPGIGKTTSAHLMAKEAGYSPIELNASDARSKKLIENSTNIDNASLDGFFQGTGVKSTSVIGDIKIDRRTCLILDEVDGMSGGDRGGVGAMNALIKKTRIPMVLICNDRTLQKMKPLQATTYNMSFRRPGPNEVRSRIMSILYKEKLKIPANVLDELVKGAGSDIRQVLNMLSTFKLSKSDMDFDEGKQLLKMNEKNTILTPFSIIDKLTSPYAFSRTNKESLNDKLDLYFHDFSFVPMFMQEHYLKTQPSATNTFEGPEKNLKHLELISKAADSCSDGDLVDRMIHGSEQHWSLLPLHGFASTVRPAYYTYGPMRPSGGGAGGGWGPSFPQWLGQNSKQGKLQRQLTDIQIRMRLRVSGSKQEIRETYMPMLAAKIVLPLVNQGSDAVEEIVSCMDDYYLGKEDWDAFVELGVDQMKDDLIMKKIPTAVKSSFTRQYNKSDHPIAFHKGDMFAMSKKKIPDQGPAPDNEDVFEEDEPVVDEEEEGGEGGTGDEGKEDEINEDLSKDRLIRSLKPKGGKKVEKKKK